MILLTGNGKSVKHFWNRHNSADICFIRHVNNLRVPWKWDQLNDILLQMDVLNISFPVSALASYFAGHLTSIVSASVSFMSWMFRGITPSAGTGKSISSGTVSFGGRLPAPEELDVFDRRATSWNSSSVPQLRGRCFCCITDTWTVFCWSSSDGGWSSYVDIFSYATETTGDVLSPLRRTQIYRHLHGFSLPWRRSSERASVFGDGQESKLYIWTLKRSPWPYCYMWDLKGDVVKSSWEEQLFTYSRWSFTFIRWKKTDYLWGVQWRWPQSLKTHPFVRDRSSFLELSFSFRGSRRGPAWSLRCRWSKSKQRWHHQGRWA